MSVTYTATLPVREETVALLADLLDAERGRRGTRTVTRALTTRDQAYSSYGGSATAPG